MSCSAATRSLEPGGGDAASQAVAVAAVDLVLEDELKKLQRAELGLARVRGPSGQGGHQAAQAQALEAADQIRGDLHRQSPPSGDGRSSGGRGRTEQAARR